MPTLMGKYKVPHFDVKGESHHLFTDPGIPTTLLLTSFYWDNFIYLGMGPKKGPDGKLAITLRMDDKKLSSIAAEDIGRCAYGIFKRGSELIGKTVGIAGGHLTGAEMPGSPLQRRAAGRVPQFRVPRCRRSGQYVPVQTRFQRLLLRGAQSGILAFPESIIADL
jgi:NmrA-like family protein